MNILIVIPVLNGEKHIEKCINCLDSLILSKDMVKIIVIDNGSIDRTTDILKKKEVDYRIIKNANISRLRNIGSSVYQSDYIGFVDSDCYVHKDWLQQAKKIFFSDKKIGAAGSYYSASDQPTWVESLWVKSKIDIEGPVNFLPGGNIIVSRSIFEKVGGFDESLVTGEDYDLCDRIRKTGHIVFNSKKITSIHMGNFKTLSEIIIKERWYGKGMLGPKRSATKPLLATYMFIFLLLSTLISVLSKSNLLITTNILILILMIFTVSIKFSSNAKEKKIIFAIKFFPISAAYLIGRTLSVIDYYIINYSLMKRQ